MYTFIPINIK